MTRVVLDASVLVACLFKDGNARRTLLDLSAEVLLLAPAELPEEARRQLSRVQARAGLDRATLEGILSLLLERIEVVSRAGYAPFEERAKELARAADAEADWPYVALALAEKAPIWTYDKDFRRVVGLKVLTTAEVQALEQGSRRDAG